MGDGLEDDNAREPTMKEIQGIERQPQERNQGIVSTGQEDERNQVDGSHGAGSIPDDAGYGTFGLTEGSFNDAEGDIEGHQGRETDCLKTTRKGAHADGTGQLEFAVVSSAEQRGVDDMLLQPGHPVIPSSKVPLRIIVETGEASEVGGDANRRLPQEEKSGRSGHHRQGEMSVVELESVVERFLITATSPLPSSSTLWRSTTAIATTTSTATSFPCRGSDCQSGKRDQEIAGTHGARLCLLQDSKRRGKGSARTRPAL